MIMDLFPYVFPTVYVLAFVMFVTIAILANRSD